MTEPTFDWSKQASGREPHLCLPGVDPPESPARFASRARLPQISDGLPSGHHTADCCCYSAFVRVLVVDLFQLY